MSDNVTHINEAKIIRPRPFLDAPAQWLAATVSIGVTKRETQKLVEEYNNEGERARMHEAAKIAGELSILQDRLAKLENHEG